MRNSDVPVSAPRSKRFDWKNLGLRAASATLLIPAVLAAIYFGWPLQLLIAASIVLLAREWGQMSASKAPGRIGFAVAVGALAALSLASLNQFWGAWAVVFIGAVLAGGFALAVRERGSDAAFGVLYIAGPCVALSWLRAMPNPISWTIMLFTVTWSADIFAFVAGNALKGPKLSPRLSPNKTWAGFVGGLIAAMLAAMGVAAVSTAKVGVVAAAWIGLAGGLATMGGDLWESMLKRRFGVKDSGDIIPGHGGLLDRVDGLMFAVLAIAGARLIYQTGWNH